MKKTWRANYRFVMTGLALTVIPLLTLVLLWPLVFSPRVRTRFLMFCFKCMTKSMLYFMRVRVTVQGSVPKGSFFMVGNHVSYVDILALASVTGAAFVAKKEVKGWPLVGWAATLYQSIFLDRESKHDIRRVTDAIAENMQRGGRVIVFPEGTSSSGQSVLPFFSPLLEWPAKNNFSVHAVALSYKSNDPSAPAAQSVCWWGDMDFGPHFMRLLQLDRVDVTVCFAPETTTGTDRKLLAKAVESVVNAHFTPST